MPATDRDELANQIDRITREPDALETAAKAPVRFGKDVEKLSKEPFFRPHKHHWKAKVHIDKEFREIAIAEVLSITGGLLAGTILAINIDQILLIPGLLILLPGFLEMRGNISGSLAARLSTALDVRKITSREENSYFVRQNIIATFAEALIVSLSLAAIAYAVTYFIFGTATLSIFLIAVLAAILSNVIEDILTTKATFWLYRKGLDPNNVMGPYVTTTGDIVSVFCLLFAVFVVSWI